MHMIMQDYLFSKKNLDNGIFIVTTVAIIENEKIRFETIYNKITLDTYYQEDNKKVIHTTDNEQVAREEHLKFLKELKQCI